MRNSGPYQNYNNGFNRQHLIAAIIAAVLSVGLHLALIIALPGLKFSASLTAQQQQDPTAKKMRLTDVVMPKNRDEKVWSEAVGPGDLSKRLNIEQSAEELVLTPDKTTTEPPLIIQENIAGEESPVLEPDAVATREHWESRQDIIAIDSKSATDEIDILARHNIPVIERVINAPDILDPVDRDAPSLDIKHTSVGIGVAAPIVANISNKAGERGNELSERSTALDVGKAPVEKSEELFSEPPEKISEFKPIEDFLKASITTYTTIKDFRYGYFRIDISRSGKQLLPILPKDILLVQDCSASMSEQRLYFCREALEKCLAYIGTNDRFNVVSFKDTTDYCFDDWQKYSPATRIAAKNFIKSMQSGGNTDLYASMRQLIKGESDQGRPVIAIMVSDGRPTTGITDSTRIIGEVTKLNDGRVSIFSMGTTAKANSYLLDLLSYCNRGDSRLVRSGRWGIPDELSEFVNSVNRPVLSDIKFHFSNNDEIEVYPALTSNLYLDKTLVLYGRYPRGTENILFQVFGDAVSERCDMIFELPLDRTASSKEKTIRTSWAQQKLYTLLGEYAREKNDITIAEIKRTARSYRLPVPFRGKF